MRTQVEYVYDPGRGVCCSACRRLFQLHDLRVGARPSPAISPRFAAWSYMHFACVNPAQWVAMRTAGVRSLVGMRSISHSDQVRAPAALRRYCAARFALCMSVVARMYCQRTQPQRAIPQRSAALAAQSRVRARLQSA